MPAVVAAAAAAEGPVIRCLTAVNRTRREQVAAPALDTTGTPAGTVEMTSLTADIWAALLPIRVHRVLAAEVFRWARFRPAVPVAVLVLLAEMVPPIQATERQKPRVALGAAAAASVLRVELVGAVTTAPREPLGERPAMRCRRTAMP